MKLSRLSSLLLAIATSTFADSSDLVISTDTGTYIGLINGSAPSVRQFLNIPYAQPPDGPRRWLPPKAPTTDSSDKLDATRFPYSCAQYLGSSPSVYNQDAPEWIIPSAPYPPAAGAMPPSSNEACLALAIWTPTGNPENLPVIMFMTGGGFNNGGIEIGYQLPHQWVQRTKTHIVVTINYRLSIMGFPNAAGLEDQNLGFLDQRMALEWVRDNIAAFGGDPKQITLWGQSAGAASVDVHNFAFKDDVIAQGLFMMSGTAFLVGGNEDTAHSNFSFVADKLGCGDLDASAELTCMRDVPAKKIVEYVGNYNENNVGGLPGLDFGPIPDDRVVFKNYTQRYVRGLYSGIPAIVSNAADEGAGLTTYPKNNRSAGPWQVAADRITVSSFICPSHNTSKLRQGTGSTTYRYQYAGNFSNVSPRGWMGAYHDSDLAMMMGTYNDFRSLEEGEELKFQRDVSQRMQNLLLAFMSAPLTAVMQLGWADYSTSDILRFAGSEGRVAQNVSMETVDGVCFGAGTYDSSP